MNVAEYKDRAAVNLPEMLHNPCQFVSLERHPLSGQFDAPGENCACTAKVLGRVTPRECRECERTYISGSFCVSSTAAMGMPKFEAGPQKSAFGTPVSQLFICHSSTP